MIVGSPGAHSRILVCLELDEEKHENPDAAVLTNHVYIACQYISTRLIGLKRQPARPVSIFKIGLNHRDHRVSDITASADLNHQLVVADAFYSRPLVSLSR